MSDLRLVVFDVDGTLVDSQNHIVSGMEAAFSQVGLTMPTRQQVLSIVGLSLPQAFAALAPEASQNQNRQLVEAYKASYVRLRSADAAASSPLYPGARDALERLRGDDHLLLGVATGKSRRGLDILLDAHGLTGFFDNEQVADHHPSKPHPSMLLASTSQLGVDITKSIMVGDTEYDMQMAGAAGVQALGVSWGYHPVERLGAAQAVIDDFAALDGAVAKLFEAVV